MRSLRKLSSCSQAVPVFPVRLVYGFMEKVRELGASWLLSERPVSPLRFRGRTLSASRGG
ncbi:hypothetical protein C1O54_09265 [Akkermansia muciniphila]|nr:hypothetical protein C1O54_09265 [Akkermansia muciniphila]QAA60319.1 hypothetical protein C1O57_09310 [Akkermansia muciniphila]